MIFRKLLAENGLGKIFDGNDQITVQWRRPDKTHSSSTLDSVKYPHFLAFAGSEHIQVAPRIYS